MLLCAVGNMVLGGNADPGYEVSSAPFPFTQKQPFRLTVWEQTLQEHLCVRR